MIRAGAVLAAAIAAAPPADARPAQCLLFVAGQEITRGPCDFTSHGGDGSFQIMGLNGRHFAQVDITSPGVAVGYWNEAPYAGHAHSPLGTLSRDEGCWVNDTASVCAY